MARIKGGVVGLPQAREILAGKAPGLSAALSKQRGGVFSEETARAQAAQRKISGRGRQAGSAELRT
mgnify:CR=1 FL=1